MVVINFPSGRRETIQSNVSIESFQSESFEPSTYIGKLLENLPLFETNVSPTRSCSVLKQHLETLFNDLTFLHDCLDDEVSDCKDSVISSTSKLSAVVSSSKSSLHHSKSLLSSLLNNISVPQHIVSAGNDLADAYQALTESQNDEKVLSNLLSLLNPSLPDDVAIKEAGLSVDFTQDLEPTTILTIVDSFSSLQHLFNKSESDGKGFSFQNLSIPPEFLEILVNRITKAEQSLYNSCNEQVFKFITRSVKLPPNPFLVQTKFKFSVKRIRLKISLCSLPFVVPCFQLERLHPDVFKCNSAACTFITNNVKNFEISPKLVIDAANSVAFNTPLVGFFSSLEGLVKSFLPVLVFLSDCGLDDVCDWPEELNAETFRFKCMKPTVCHVIHVIKSLRSQSNQHQSKKKSSKKKKTLKFSRTQRSPSITEAKPPPPPKPLSLNQYLEGLVSIGLFGQRFASRLADVVVGISELDKGEVQPFKMFLKNVSNFQIQKHLQSYQELELAFIMELTDLDHSLVPSVLIGFSSLDKIFSLDKFENCFSLVFKSCERCFQLFEFSKSFNYSLSFVEFQIHSLCSFVSHLLTTFSSFTIHPDNVSEISIIPKFFTYIRSLVALSLNFITEFKNRWQIDPKDDVINNRLITLLRRLSEPEPHISKLLSVFLEGVEICSEQITSELLQSSSNMLYDGRIAQKFSSSLSPLISELGRNVSCPSLKALGTEVSFALFRGILKGISSEEVSKIKVGRFDIVQRPLLFLKNLGNDLLVLNLYKKL
ncbi:hypothetical protein GEMRC1_000307 [Eukaryota sp. GEM-RC1]